MNTRILLLLLFAFQINLTAQNIHVKGKVVDIHKAPLDYVEVKVGNAISVKTDENGIFETEITYRNHANSNVNIICKKYGFYDLELEIPIGEKLLVNIDPLRLLKDWSGTAEKLRKNNLELKKEIALLKETKENEIAALTEINFSIIKQSKVTAERYSKKIQQMEKLFHDLIEQKQLLNEKILLLKDKLNIAENENKELKNLIQQKKDINQELQDVIEDQERIISEINIKNKLRLNYINIDRINKSSVEINFNFLDENGNIPTYSKKVPVTIEVFMIQKNGSSMKLLFGKNTHSKNIDFLKKELIVSQKNSVIFHSEENFSKRKRRNLYQFFFKIDEILVGVHTLYIKK